jgi:Transglycosylase SLT domain
MDDPDLLAFLPFTDPDLDAETLRELELLLAERILAAPATSVVEGSLLPISSGEAEGKGRSGFFPRFAICCLCLLLAGFALYSLAPHTTPSSKPGDRRQSSTQQEGVPAALAANLTTSQYVALARQDAINAGIPPVYFVRQITMESGFNPRAVSPAGAIGIAQFMPSTAAGLGINPWDPVQSLRGAANLMASYNRAYGGNYAMALAAYNAGSGTVQYAINTCGKNWYNCLPAETQHYITVILG